MKYCLMMLITLCAGQTSSSSQVYEVDRPQLLQDVRTLSADEMEGRRVATTGSAKARAYIIERFIQSGLNPYGDSFEQPFTFIYRNDKNKVHQKGINVIGFIKGTGSERTIAITAHYDHLGIRNGTIYNGANDNASGVAALFAIGSYFIQNSPRNSMIIAALDAEENSGSGGTTFVANLDRRKIVVNVNLDMIGRDRNNTLYAAGTHHYPFLKPFVEKIAAKSPVRLLPGHDQPNIKKVEDWTKESDHYAFHALGIPFLYFGVEDYEQHHKPTDDFENLTHDFFVNAVKTILIALTELDSGL